MGRCDPSPSPPPSVHSVASAPDLSRLKISFTEPQRISPELVLLDTADRLISHADTAPEPRTLRPPGSASPASTPPSSATPPPIIPTLSLSPSPPPPVETPPYPQHAPTFPSRPASPPRKQQHRKSPSWTLPFSSARRQAEREKEQERLDRLAALSELQKSGARVVPGSFEVVEHLGAAPPPGLDPAALADRANAERLAGPMSADRIAERALSEKLSRAGTPTSVGSFAADDDESALSTLWRKLSRRTASPTPSVDRARERERERDAGESVVRDAVVRLADGGDNTPFLKITYEVTPGTPGLTVQGVQGVVGIGFLAEVWERGRGPPGSVS
ncbi:hypothetical protein DFJ74DRAFT_695259 [Hyaloraphidium curvatum]|nr:hypothetical protein DFJ74DRAFT_695259 [Hyaloraphidium curvatum]